MWPWAKQYMVACPACGRAYDLVPLMPRDAKQATIMCECGTAFELSRGKFGLRWPRVTYRPVNVKVPEVSDAP